MLLKFRMWLLYVFEEEAHHHHHHMCISRAPITNMDIGALQQYITMNDIIDIHLL